MHGIRLNKKRNLQLFGLRKSAYNFFWILKEKKKNKLFRKNPKSGENLPSVVSKASNIYLKKILKSPFTHYKLREKNKDL